MSEETKKMPKKDLPYKNKGDLTNGPISKHLIRLTVPMIWGIFAIISIQLIDTYFISLLGTNELAGVSFTFPVTMGLSHLIFGINIAMSSVISRMIGEKKIDDARRITLHGIVMAFTTASVTSLLCYIFLGPIFTLLGADDLTLPVIKEYMPLWLLGFVFLSIPMNGNSAIRAGGDTTRPAIVMTFISLLNLALDPVLIFGYFGAPAMGVAGAALATFIAYILGTILGLYFLIFDKKLIALDGLHLDKFKDSMRRLLFIAIPAGITNIIQPVTNAVIIALLATYGPEAVAAFGVASRVEAFALLVIIALATSMAPIIGQNWGAEKFDRVHKTINLSIGFNVVWSFAVALVLGVFSSAIARAFSDDPQVVRYTVLFFWIVPFSYAFGNLVFGWASSFNAMGMPQRAFVMITVKSLILTVPAVLIGGHLYGVIGIFIAIAAVNISSGAFFHALSWRTCMKREHAIEETVNA